MNRSAILAGAFAVMMPLSGCATRQDLVEPSTVTLEQALVDTVDALAAARERGLEKKTNFQFYGCTVTAQFNISATQTVTNKIALSATGGPPAAIAPISINLSGSNEVADQGTRGNTVTVVLATPGCIPNQIVAVAPKAARPGAKTAQPPAGKVGSAPTGKGLGIKPRPQDSVIPLQF